ncbi:MAG TPA: 4'-phosphopantetheinyl transferase superfamily protein [Fibrobacteria bacterium]|nr:4'-phosphopantetheinyl transferase superfamily protein [Fibrobacteria bacterium]
MIRLFAVPGAARLDAAEYGFFLGIASAPRKARARRFFRREDACRCLIAEALLRHGFAALTGRDMDGASLQTGAYGKPALPGDGPHFNLSHSGDWVICGFAAEEIGVDIEAHHDVHAGLAERFFSPAEQAWLSQVPGADAARKRFFDVWSLKESYIKAFGRGLACPLESFSCLPDGTDGAARLQRADADLPMRHLRLLELHPGYSAALCTVAEASAPDPQILKPAGLAESLRRLEKLIPAGGPG